MKQFLRNTFVLILLVTIMAPLSFAFMSYRLQLKLIKRAVKQELIQETNREDLVSFNFNINSQSFQSLKWEHDHEFEFDGKMFDIVEADTVGNTINYLCFPDKQETALNLAFNKKLKDRYANDVPSKNRANQMLALIYGLYFIPDATKDDFKAHYSQIAHTTYKEHFQSIYLDLSVPPPKFFA